MQRTYTGALRDSLGWLLSRLVIVTAIVLVVVVVIGLEIGIVVEIAIELVRSRLRVVQPKETYVHSTRCVRSLAGVILRLVMHS